MAFSVPQMPLTCNIWRAAHFAGSLSPPPDVVSDCNASFGRAARLQTGEGLGFYDYLCLQLLLPAHTDIRDGSGPSAAFDYVEVPAGTGRWYGVSVVDDVGQGFPNEHRIAMCSKVGVAEGWPWPEPIP